MKHTQESVKQRGQTQWKYAGNTQNFRTRAEYREYAETTWIIRKEYIQHTQGIHREYAAKTQRTRWEYAGNTHRTRGEYLENSSCCYCVWCLLLCFAVGFVMGFHRKREILDDFLSSWGDQRTQSRPTSDKYKKSNTNRVIWTSFLELFCAF